MLDVEGRRRRVHEDARGRARARRGDARRSVTRAGREVVCLLTDMDQPLGRAVGNALEIREAIATLRGEGPPDFTELVLEACARLLALSDLGVDREEGRDTRDGPSPTAPRWQPYERWIAAQGGDPDEDALATRAAS